MFGYGGESNGHALRGVCAVRCVGVRCGAPYLRVVGRSLNSGRKALSLTGGLTGERARREVKHKQDVLVLRSRGVDLHQKSGLLHLNIDIYNGCSTATDAGVG